MAAVLASGEGTWLSFRSGAMLWCIRRTERGLIEVTSPRTGRGRPGIQRHRAELPPDEVTVHHGVPVTTVPRTLLDLATVLTPRQLARAVNEAEVQRLWDPLSLDALLERYPQRPGVPALRELLGQRVTFTRGELEKRFLEFLSDAGLPLPETNAHIQISGLWYEVDCLWRAERVIVELDGRATHDTRQAFEADRARDRVLQAAGFRVIRITWRQLHATPAAVAADLRALLRLGRTPAG
jgi:REase_MTES_1575